jgi:hypothetical protein
MDKKNEKAVKTNSLAALWGWVWFGAEMDSGDF